MSEPSGSCPAGGERPLTKGEVGLVREVFGAAIDTDKVRIKRRKWFWFQPERTTMAPTGHLHFHPGSANYCDDFSTGSPHKQAHFIHEMTHVWQTQRKGWWYLPLVAPFQRKYSYTLKPGKTLSDYNIEQQAEIVRHAFMLRRGWKAPDAPALAELEKILPFA